MILLTRLSSIQWVPSLEAPVIYAEKRRLFFLLLYSVTPARQAPNTTESQAVPLQWSAVSICMATRTRQTVLQDCFFHQA